MKGIEQNLEKYISDQDISKRVKEISNEISRLYFDKNPILIGVLNGSFIFLSDLIRHLNIHCEVDFIKISSYEGKKSVGKINMTKGLDLDIKNRSVIIIEDIIEGCGDCAPLVEVDRAAAIAFAVAQAHAGDTVLIAGKGHETYQEVAGVRLPFSDADCAAAQLLQRRAA